MSMRFPQWYYPKIQYWASQLENAASYENLSRVEFAIAKLEYFCERQASLEREKGATV